MDMLSWYDPRHRRRGLLAAGALFILIVLADWWIQSVSLGFLYFFPILLAAGFLTRTQIVMVAVMSAASVELFSPMPPAQTGPRLLMMVLAFLATGWFAREAGLRRELQEQLRVLVETSPAAILTVNYRGEVVMANHAAHRLLDFEGQSLAGVSLRPYLPMLATVRPDERGPQLRTALETRGRRRNGEGFLAHIWFSTIAPPSAACVAAIVLDASEDLREREEGDLHRMMLQSRLLVGAVFHEIRNLCGAISVLHANLGRDAGVTASKDYEALGTLVEGLRTLAAAELRPAGEAAMLPRTDLSTVLEDLRIILAPEVEQSGIHLSWEVPETLPRVNADQHALLQAFLNLSQNSLRVLEEAPKKEMCISAKHLNGKVQVRFQDSGPGVAHPERLFKPFQEGADGTGLGLYVTRALLRGFSGELRYEPIEPGACFTVELALSPAEVAGS